MLLLGVAVTKREGWRKQNMLLLASGQRTRLRFLTDKRTGWGDGWRDVISTTLV